MEYQKGWRRPNTGLTGLTGSTGGGGDKGLTGAQGGAGDKGLTGTTGTTGDTGLTGLTGAQGGGGDKGLTGGTGTGGDKGLTGSTGTGGDAGLTGLTGATGPDGDIPADATEVLYINAAGTAVTGDDSMTYASSVFKATRLRGGDGLLATPSFAFANDIDTGAYLPSTGTLGVVAAGAELMTIGTGDVSVDVSAIFKADKASVQTITTTSDTLNTTTDAGQVIVCTNGSAVDVDLPALAGADVGTTYLIVQLGAGQVNINADGSDVINGTTDVSIQNQWSAVTVIGYATGKWVAIGDV